jgi:hypothetical protein
MITWASGLQIGEGRFSRPQRGVGVILMPDAGLDTTRCVEVPPGDGVRPLIVPGMVVAVFIDRRCVADMVEVTN